VSILIIDPRSEWYRGELGKRFAALEIRIANDARAAQGQLADAEAILGMGHHFSDALVEGAKRMKWIQAFTTGVDQVLALRSLAQEVIVTSTRGIHGPQMSEMAFLHMLNLSRDYRRIARNQERGMWERWPQIKLAGKTVVILGVGHIAEALALRCKAFAMNVVGVTGTPRELPGFDRMMHRSQLGEAAALADFLVVLVPYSRENDKVVNARVLAAMKPSAYLVNIARGGVCDEQALLDAVRAKRIAGVGLDVFGTEPLPAGHPFWAEERILITPKMGGMSDGYHEQVLPVVEKNLGCFVEGRFADMINVVPH
jgi:phosphoglycerate dehydrogenase-like enzyme